MDSSKYGKSALLTYAHVSEMEKLVVAGDVLPELKELCLRNSVEVEKVSI